MKADQVTLTVYFEDPFWVGVFTKVSGEKLKACKVTFSAEPKDYEVYELMNREFFKLKFSPDLQVTIRKESSNPKKLRRDVKKQTGESGIGTKSQQALKLMQEEKKTARREKSKQEKEEEKIRRFELRTKKRKEKHKGK